MGLLINLNEIRLMPSFDIVSKIDLQELDNAINSVLRELTNRFDFKGAKFSVELNNKEKEVVINAEDEYKLSQIQASLRVFCTKRGIDVRALEFGKEEKASGNSFRQVVKIKQGLDQEAAKTVVKLIKDQKMKVQASIKGDEVKVDGKKIDDLQEVIALLKKSDLSLPLQFINFRN